MQLHSELIRLAEIAGEHHDKNVRVRMCAHFLVKACEEQEIKIFHPTGGHDLVEQLRTCLKETQ